MQDPGAEAGICRVRRQGLEPRTCRLRVPRNASTAHHRRPRNRPLTCDDADFVSTAVRRCPQRFEGDRQQFGSSEGHWCSPAGSLGCAPPPRSSNRCPTSIAPRELCKELPIRAVSDCVETGVLGCSVSCRNDVLRSSRDGRAPVTLCHNTTAARLVAVLGYSFSCRPVHVLHCPTASLKPATSSRPLDVDR